MRTVSRAFIGVFAAIGASSVTVSALAARFAHQLVTPAKNKPDDVNVVASTGESITFTTNPVSAAPGRYGLYWDNEHGHAQIGEILRQDDDQVTRKILRITRGKIGPGPARMSSYFYAKDPGEEFGLPCEEVMLATPVGPAPCWVIPSGNGQVWAALSSMAGERGGLR